MHLSDADLRDLAAFLARRMTTDFAPVDPTDAPLPGVTAVDAWMAVLVEARDGGWIPSLVRRITAARPHDATLREAAQLLEPRRRSPELAAAALLFVTGAAGLGAVAAGGVVTAALLVAAEAVLEQESMYTSAESSAFIDTSDEVFSQTTSPDPGEVISAARPAEGLSLEGGGSHDAMAQDAVPADPDGDPEAVSAVLRGEDGPPDDIPVSGVAALAPPGGPHSKCGGQPGTTVGYWYAGRRSPGALGDVVVLDRMINVRTDYPHKANRWDTRSRIHCVLKPGDLARIRRTPIRVDGGHYWVPVFPGDITAAPTDGTAMVDPGDEG